jgi:PKD repeat protein
MNPSQLQYYRVFVYVSDYPKALNEMPFDVSVDWGDGTFEAHENLRRIDVLHHDYEKTGNYAIRITLTNASGSVTRILPVSVLIPWKDGDSIGVRLYDLDVVDVKPSPAVAHNFPDGVRVTGQMVLSSQYDIVESLNSRYRLDVILQASGNGEPLELLKYPVIYERIPKEEIIVVVPSNTSIALDYIEHVLPRTAECDYANISPSKETKVVFKFTNVDDDKKSYYENRALHKVVIYGNERFVKRIESANSAFGAPVKLDSTDVLFVERGWVLDSDHIPFDIWKIETDFGGVELPGFMFAIPKDVGHTEHGYWLSADINVLYEDGSIQPVSLNHIDFYQAPFLYPANSFAETVMQTHATILGGVRGSIVVSSAKRVEKVEMVVSSSGVNRISHDNAVEQPGGTILLTILNTAVVPKPTVTQISEPDPLNVYTPPTPEDIMQNQMACIIHVNDGPEEFLIYSMEFYGEKQPEQMDSVVRLVSGTDVDISHLTSDMDFSRCDGMYFMATAVPVIDTFVSMHSVDNFDPANVQIEGLFALMTIYGEITGKLSCYGNF